MIRSKIDGTGYPLGIRAGVGDGLSHSTTLGVGDARTLSVNNDRDLLAVGRTFSATSSISWLLSTAHHFNNRRWIHLRRSIHLHRSIQTRCLQVSSNSCTQANRHRSRRISYLLRMFHRSSVAEPVVRTLRAVPSRPAPGAARLDFRSLAAGAISGGHAAVAAAADHARWIA